MMIRKMIRKKILKNLSITVSLIGFALPVAAKNPTWQSSVLPPGARIVPGDPAKNEFFILAKNEPKPAASAVDHSTSTIDEVAQTKQTDPVIQEVVKKKDLNEMKSALNEAIDKEIKTQTLSQRKMKLHKATQDSLAKNQKTLSKIQLALNKTFPRAKTRQNVAERSAPKIQRTAGKKTPKKAVVMKSATQKLHVIAKKNTFAHKNTKSAYAKKVAVKTPKSKLVTAVKSKSNHKSEVV